MIEDQKSFFSGRRVWVAGHTDTIGSAIVRRLWQERCEIILTSRAQLDLLRQADVERWMRRHRPEVVFLAAERRAVRARKPEVRARALQDTLTVNLNVLEAAFQSGAESLVNLTGVRSRSIDAPLEGFSLSSDEALHAWAPEELAQLAALRLTLGYVRRSTSRYVALMPLHVYSPHETDPLANAALAPLLEQIACAIANEEPRLRLEVGALARRGLVHVDDLADGAVFAAAFASEGVIRLAPGGVFEAQELIRAIAQTVGFDGELEIVGGSAAPGDAGCPPANPIAVELGWRPKLAAAEMAQQIHQSWIKRGDAQRRSRPH